MVVHGVSNMRQLWCHIDNTWCAKDETVMALHSWIIRGVTETVTETDMTH